MTTAAMRLRQLANSQSVVFFAPPEVHQSILDLRSKRPGEHIDSHDVICWLLEQTCRGIQQMQPLYFSQGADFCRRTQAASDNPDFLVKADQRLAYVNTLQQTEQQTLKQLYEPSKPKAIKNWSPSDPGIAVYMKELHTRRECFQDQGDAVHGSALQEVEQEREVAYEVEAIHEVQKPVHFKPLSFNRLHRDIISFAKTGKLAAEAGGHEHIFSALQRTALGQRFRVIRETATTRFYLSREFSRTVDMPPCHSNDNFLVSLELADTRISVLVVQERSICPI